MPKYTWRCFVCQEANVPEHQECAACGCPAHVSGREIDMRRNAYSGTSFVAKTTVAKSPSLLILILVLIFIDIAATFSVMSVTMTNGGNPIGAGIVGLFLLLPVPVLLTIACAILAYDGYKTLIEKKVNVNESNGP